MRNQTATATKVLVPGQKGTTSGFPATVLRHYDGSMYEVRVPGGVTCIDASDFIPEATMQESDSAVHLYVLTDGDLTDTEKWMTVAEAREANEHAEKVTDGTWGWYRKHADVMAELEEPRHPHPRIRMERVRDSMKHDVELTGAELKIIRRALQRFASGQFCALPMDETRDAAELLERLSSAEVPNLARV